MLYILYYKADFTWHIILDLYKFNKFLTFGSASVNFLLFLLTFQCIWVSLSYS